MGSEMEDTGVFSPLVSKRNAVRDESFRNKQADISETEKTDVFSPDVSLRSCIVKCSDPLASKENTPPLIQTPSFNKQLEGIERRGAKRKKNFGDALHSQNSEDDSYDKVEAVLDDPDNQEIRTKRVKRFELNPGVSVDVSNSDDNDTLSLGIAASCSQEEKKTKQKSRFVLSKNVPESEESANYSDIEPASQKSQKVEQKRFVAPPSFLESDDSISLVSVFKSKNKNEILKQMENQNLRYSQKQKSISQNNEKIKRKPRFAQPSSSQESDESLQYSDILKSVSKDDKTKKKNVFVIPSSQETEDSRQYSDIFDSLFRKREIVKRNDERSFTDPTSQEIGHSLGYSDILVSQTASIVAEKQRFVDPTSQEIGNSQRYSNILVSQTEPTVTENRRFIDFTSQENGDSLHYSDIKILNVGNERAANSQNSLNDTITLTLSFRSKCVPGETDECSASCESSEKDQQKTNSTDFTSVRSICIDTIRSSFDISAPSSTSGMTDKPNNTSNSVPVISALNTSCERTLVCSNSLEDADGSITLIESKNETSNTPESSSAVNESENKSSNVEESSSMADESENKSSAVEVSSLMADEFKNESADIQKSNSTADTSESRNENSLRCSENASSFVERDTESIVTPAMSVQSIMIDTIPNSSNAASSNGKIIEESVYVPFNPSSLMLSETVVEPLLNNHDRDFSIGKNESIRTESPLPEVVQNNELPSPALPLTGENIKEHDYAAVQISNMDEIVETPVTDLIDEFIAEGISHAPLVEAIANKSFIMQSDTQSNEEIGKETAEPPTDTPCTQEHGSSVISPTRLIPSNVKIEKKIRSPNTSMQSAKRSGSQVSILDELDEPIAPVVEVINPDLQQLFSSVENPEKSSAPESPTNAAQFREQTITPNDTVPKSNYSLRTKKSRSPSAEAFNDAPLDNTGDGFCNLSSSGYMPERNSSVISSRKETSSHSRSSTSSSTQNTINPASQQLFSPVEKPKKSLAPKSLTNAVQFREQTITPNDTVPKSNYSLRTRKSRSSDGKKSPEPVLSSSAAAFNGASLDNTGDGFFNLSTSVKSRNSSIISSRKETSSRSRSSTSYSTQNTRTSSSTSSVSIFSKSKIGRPSVAATATASAEFKVPRVPASKAAPKKKNKKKREDDGLSHLPSRPNFPEFDTYQNPRFYNFLIKKMEPKYGIRTNNEVVKLAKYISEVVKEVIAMKTGYHHTLVEEMKKVLFRKGIVITHQNFYTYCQDYMPSWFKRKAIPMLVPSKCPPNVIFDLQLLWDPIE